MNLKVSYFAGEDFTYKIYDSIKTEIGCVVILYIISCNYPILNKCVSIKSYKPVI